jgi:hypothetical protein
LLAIDVVEFVSDAAGENFAVEAVIRRRQATMAYQRVASLRSGEPRTESSL